MVARVTFLFLICFFQSISVFAQDESDKLLLEGIDLYGQKKYEEARLIFQKAQKLDPENSEILSNLGMTHYSLSEFKLALENLEKSLEIDPQNASAQLFSGLCRMELEDYEKAIQNFEASQKLDPEIEQLALFQQGLAHYKNDSLEDSQRLFNEAITSDPNSDMVTDAREFIDIVKKEKRNQKRLKLYANAKFISDDNVILEEQDTIANEEDVAVSYNFGADFRLFKIGEVEFKLGYDFSQLLYRRVTEFDTQSHSGHSSFSFDNGEWDIGFAYNFYYSYLDRQEFLASNSFNPSFGFSLTEDLYTSFSYTHTRKNFLNGSNDRDAINNSINISQFLFFMESKAYLRLGYGFALEDTQEPRFDFIGHTASMGLKLPLFAKVSAIFNYSYSYQDYKSVTASIGEQRFDASHYLGLSINVPVTDSLGLNVYMNRTMSNSNLASIDFVQNVSTVHLNYRF